MSFDTVARLYRSIELLTFGTALQHARVAYLDAVRDARSALIVGEGDGRFLRELMDCAPLVQVECVDGSAEMLALAEARLTPAQRSRVRFVHADLADYVPTGPYDLVVTHFVLDCFGADALRSLVRRIATQLEPNARWLLADFAIPRGAVRGARARFWLAIMYRFFGLAAGLRARGLVDPTPLLEAQGLERVQFSARDAGFITSALWQRARA